MATADVMTELNVKKSTPELDRKFRKLAANASWRQNVYSLARYEVAEVEGGKLLRFDAVAVNELWVYRKLIEDEAQGNRVTVFADADSSPLAVRAIVHAEPVLGP